MQRRSPLRRRSPLKARSAKGQAVDAERRQLRMRLSVERPVCEVCRCCRSVDLHEKLFRSRGGSATDETNVVAVCRGPGSCNCHDRAHSDRAWAEANGLRVSRYGA